MPPTPMPPNSARFFSDLPAYPLALSQLLSREAHFAEVPADWHVVVTDIKNSTAAFAGGRHEQVNLIATGSIIATLNLARRAGLEVPFFFGGDGATLIVPPTLLDSVLRALRLHRANTRESFGLDLRVGAVPVAALYDGGHQLKISRLRVSAIFSIPVLLGNGLAEAERRIKGEDPTAPVEREAPDLLDLTGMECRWDRIEPAEPSHEVVSLLVTAREAGQQATVFKEVVDLLDTIYGSPESRNPVSVSRLRLKSTLGKIALEMRTRLGRFSLGYLLRNWLLTLFGRAFYFRSREGRRYLEQLVALTDTLVIDGRINTVIAGTRAQREQLEAGLAELERAGRITYGLFVSRDSVMSCYVRDRTDQHIHFVDGSDGGYTRAAGVLKRKLRAAAGPPSEAP